MTKVYFFKLYLTPREGAAVEPIEGQGCIALNAADASAWAVRQFPLYEITGLFREEPCVTYISVAAQAVLRG